MTTESQDHLEKYLARIYPVLNQVLQFWIQWELNVNNVLESHPKCELYRGIQLCSKPIFQTHQEMENEQKNDELKMIFDAAFTKHQVLEVLSFKAPFTKQNILAAAYLPWACCQEGSIKVISISAAEILLAIENFTRTETQTNILDCSCTLQNYWQVVQKMPLSEIIPYRCDCDNLGI